MSFHQCKYCGTRFEYNDEVGYDREICGVKCDFLHAGKQSERDRLAAMNVDGLHLPEWINYWAEGNLQSLQDGFSSNEALRRELVFISNVLEVFLSPEKDAKP
jgi:hypothetical protein